MPNDRRRAPLALPLTLLLVAAAVVATACHPTFVVVPGVNEPGTDTLRVRDDNVVVTFRVDTLFRVDTVLETDSIYLEGTDTVTVTAVRVDTLTALDTVVHIDTVEVGPDPKDARRIAPVTRVDTVLTVDTVVVTDTVYAGADAPKTGRRRPAPVSRVDTVVRLDTIVVTDTVRVVETDTVIRSDTVRIAGQRLLFLPPGHFPPEGECRVWVHGLPPGRQAKAEPCDELGSIPDGAFVLFGGEAWDFDWDWLAEAMARPGSVPPEIVALQRRR